MEYYCWINIQQQTSKGRKRWLRPCVKVGTRIEIGRTIFFRLFWNLPSALISLASISMLACSPEIAHAAAWLMQPRLVWIHLNPSTATSCDPPLLTCLHLLPPQRSGGRRWLSDPRPSWDRPPQPFLGLPRCLRKVELAQQGAAGADYKPVRTSLVLITGLRVAASIMTVFTIVAVDCVSRRRPVLAEPWRRLTKSPA